jgi:glutamate synthase domain-containing protein 3
LVERHIRYTGSARGGALLEHWQDEAPRIVRIAPRHEVAVAAPADEATSEAS